MKVSQAPQSEKSLSWEKSNSKTLLGNILILKHETSNNTILSSLKDVVIDEKKLYLVFEFLDKDLKAVLESYPKDEFLEPMLVKVCIFKFSNSISH